MKQTLLVALILYTYHATAQQAYQLLETDQKHEIGVFFAPVFSVWDTKLSDGQQQYGDPELGYGLNLSFNTIINRYFSIQTGLMYHSMQYKLYIERNKECVVHLDNIHIPVLFTLNTDKTRILNYVLFAGPQVGFNAASSVQFPVPIEANNNNRNASESTVFCVNKLDVGVAYGAGADIALLSSKMIRLDIGYIGTFGFADRCGGVEMQGQTNLVDDNTTISTFGGYIGFNVAF